MRSEKDRAPVFVVAFLFLTRLRARGGRSDETRCGDRPIPNTHTAANYSCDRPNYPPLPPRPSSRTQAGANPFEGLTPRVPQGDTLAFGSESFCRLEEVGLGQAATEYDPKGKAAAELRAAFDEVKRLSDFATKRARRGTA